jgi:hypothetical protein
VNGIYNLPSQYILSRWTKYAKSGFYIETKQRLEERYLNAQAGLISRQATSLALKCSSSNELLDKIQKTMHDLNLEANTYLSESNEMCPRSTEWCNIIQNPSSHKRYKGITFLMFLRRT